jgi:hypothetical protein
LLVPERASVMTAVAPRRGASRAFGISVTRLAYAWFRRLPECR